MVRAHRRAQYDERPRAAAAAVGGGGAELAPRAAARAPAGASGGIAGGGEPGRLVAPTSSEIGVSRN